MCADAFVASGALKFRDKGMNYVPTFRVKTMDSTGGVDASIGSFGVFL